MSEKLIEHADEIARYAPPDHEGTANVRLVDRTFNGAFELVRGTVQPGGEAHAHAHDKEHQVSYIGRGETQVTLGERPPVTCGPGSVIRIPPGLMHRVVNAGDEPLEALIVYSPPLPDRDDTPLD